jgi:chitinase
MLTSALPAGEWALRNINLGQAATYLDSINLMTYDFTGPWSATTGHHAQLFVTEQTQPAASVNNALEYLLGQGVPSAKIVLGIPAYDRSFLGAQAPRQAYTGIGGEEGTFEYKDLPRPGTKEQVDEAACAAFCVGGDGGYVTYDNQTTVLAKAKYVKQKRLGGLFYWTGTGDSADDDRSLVMAGWNGLYR